MEGDESESIMELKEIVASTLEAKGVLNTIRVKYNNHGICVQTAITTSTSLQLSNLEASTNKCFIQGLN